MPAKRGPVQVSSRACSMMAASSWKLPASLAAHMSFSLQHMLLFTSMVQLHAGYSNAYYILAA